MWVFKVICVGNNYQAFHLINFYLYDIDSSSNLADNIYVPVIKLALDVDDISETDRNDVISCIESKIVDFIYPVFLITLKNMLIDL